MVEQRTRCCLINKGKAKRTREHTVIASAARQSSTLTTSSLLQYFQVVVIILAFLTEYALSKPTRNLTSISVESERATYQHHKTPHPHMHCIHEGSVHVTLSNGTHVHADKLEAHIRETSGEKKEKVRNALETITLHHAVTITHQDHTVTGDHGLLDTSSQTCTITGKVTITKRDKKGHTVITKAKKATLDLTTNRVTLEGSPEKPVHTLIHIVPHTTPEKHTTRTVP